MDLSYRYILLADLISGHTSGVGAGVAGYYYDWYLILFYALHFKDAAVSSTRLYYSRFNILMNIKSVLNESILNK